MKKRENNPSKENKVFVKSLQILGAISPPQNETDAIRIAELRTGNLIQLGEKIVTVDHHDIKFIATVSGHTYNPITLTEEWLYKFGFEKTNKYWHNGLGSNIFYDLENKYLRQAYGTGVNITMFAISAMNVRYVHQLQNLYSTLTGEELIISQ